MAIFPLPVTSTTGGDVGKACSRGSSPTTGAISRSTPCEWLLVGKTICYYSEVSRWRSFERLTARNLTVKVRESGERKVKRSDTFENITSVIVTLLGNKFTRLIIKIRPHALWTSLQIRRQSSFVTSQRVWSPVLILSPLEQDGSAQLCAALAKARARLQPWHLDSGLEQTRRAGKQSALLAPH